MPARLLFTAIFFLSLASHGAGDDDSVAADVQATWRLLIEPRFQAPPVYEKLAGAEATGLTAARRSEDGEPVYLSKEEWEEADMDWETFLDLTTPHADALLAEVAPRYFRDSNEVVTHAMIQSKDPFTASIALAPDLFPTLRPKLGEEIVIVIPERYTLFAFPHHMPMWKEKTDSFLRIYNHSPWPVSTEIFLLTADGLAAIATIEP